MKILKFVALLCSSIYVLSAQAQETHVEEVPKRVEVSSYKGPELRSYSQMLKGLIAYKEKRSHAPDSELYFILIPKSRNVGVQGLTMRLASDESSINIPIDEDGKFQLPLIELKHDDEYDLILNKPKGQFYIKPYVKSANLPDDSKRLGDIRLECQVRWAVERQDVSVVFSGYVNLFGSGNPCTSRAVSVFFFAPNGVNLVTLDTPGSKLSFDVNANGQYPLPVWNTELSDEGLLKYERNAGSVAKQGN